MFQSIRLLSRLLTFRMVVRSKHLYFAAVLVISTLRAGTMEKIGTMGENAAFSRFN